MMRRCRWCRTVKRVKPAVRKSGWAAMSSCGAAIPHLKEPNREVGAQRLDDRPGNARCVKIICAEPGPSEPQKPSTPPSTPKPTTPSQPAPSCDEDKHEHPWGSACVCDDGFKRRRGQCVAIEQPCPEGTTGSPPNCQAIAKHCAEPFALGSCSADDTAPLRHGSSRSYSIHPSSHALSLAARQARA
jgi:hypothetical protein